MATGVQINRSNIELSQEVSAEIMQKTQEASAIMQLARKVALPGRGMQIPVIVSDPEAAWVSETGVKPVARPTLSKKVMQAYKLAVIVPFSDEFRRDIPSLYGELVRRLPAALAQKFDATVFQFRRGRRCAYDPRFQNGPEQGRIQSRHPCCRRCCR